MCGGGIKAVAALSAALSVTDGIIEVSGVSKQCQRCFGQCQRCVRAVSGCVSAVPALYESCVRCCVNAVSAVCQTNGGGAVRAISGAERH